MRYGPVEMLVLETPEPPLGAGIVDALRELVEHGDIQIIDAVFVTVSDTGTAKVAELGELPEAQRAAIDVLVGSVTGLISDDDLAMLGTTLAPQTSAAVLLLEHRWAPRLERSVRQAGGSVRLHLRVPRDTVIEVDAVRSARTG
jgi:hypothetical protein